MAIPLNRIIAFAGPYISVVSGGVATWLVAKANVLGIKDLDQANVATQVAGGLTFTLVAVISWLGQSKWLTGHHLDMAREAEVQAAALAAHPVPPADAPPEPEHEALIALGEDLPDDEVEFASQPPGLGPVTPSADASALEELPDDDEELSFPPDQDARITPDAPDGEDVDDEAAFALGDDDSFAADDDDVHVSPEVQA